MPIEEVYPELGAGGFSRRDGSVAFYTRVNALVEPHWTVLDLGAGRGEWLEDGNSFRRDLRKLQGRVDRVVGADIDPVVHLNPSCDSTLLMSHEYAIPIDDNSIDLVVADHTFEHIERPGPWVAEITRILKPGGWVTGRTPNRWGYIGVATNLVPNSLHTRVLRRVQPDRQAIDVFPTYYKMNTQRELGLYFPRHSWDNFSYPYNPEPAYFGTSARRIRVADRLLSRAPSGLGATWHIFLRRRA